MRRVCATVTVVVALFAWPAHAQPQAPRPTYEAASLKPNTSDSGHSGTDEYMGQILFTNMPLQRLIAQAYGIAPAQVTGPPWIESDRFDVVAKYPTGVQPQDRPIMLRNLLEDRFHLVVHRDSKEASGYALVVAKSGLKLKPAEPGDDDTQHTGGRIQSLAVKKTSMTRLASLVSRYLSIPVVDHTGLDGVYDFDLRWTNEERPDGSADAEVPSLPLALEDTLGVHLQAQKVAIEVVVVDHVDRKPIEN
jgi:uncharacterized protein (TIGR03435 family)